MDKFNDKDNISVDKSGIPSLAQNMVSLFTKSVSINLNGLINSASIFAESISKIVQSSSTIVESFSHVLSDLSDTIRQVHLSAYTDEEKQMVFV